MDVKVDFLSESPGLRAVVERDEYELLREIAAARLFQAAVRGRTIEAVEADALINLLKNPSDDPTNTLSMSLDQVEFLASCFDLAHEIDPAATAIGESCALKLRNGKTMAEAQIYIPDFLPESFA